MPDDDVATLDLEETATRAAPSPKTLIGVDVGGTKTHLAIQAPGRERRDTVVPSAQWRHGQLFSDPENLTRLAALIEQTAGAENPRTVVGLHGLDTIAQRDLATSRLSALLPGSLHVLNDAELLGPACGLDDCLQLIVGTGAIAIGTDAEGTTITADGYGALLGDFGSAPALVRESLRAAFTLADEHGTDRALADPVIAHLCARYAVTELADLALAVSSEEAYDWGRHAPAVFEGYHDGSALAREVLHHASERLAGNLAAISRRGAVGTVVVGAGGVLTSQPLLQHLVTEQLAQQAPGLSLRMLDVPPVDGALTLAAGQSRR